MVSGADFFSGDDDDADAAGTSIDVWSCNWVSVAVFECCRLDVVGGWAPSYNGISSQEIASACELLGVPQADRCDITEDVQWMGRVVTGALNRRIAAGHKAQQQRR